MVTIKTNKDLYMTRGDDVYLEVEIRQRDFPYEVYEMEEGDTLYFTVRKYQEEDVDENNPILFQIVSDTNNIHIEPKYTETLSFSDYYYDVEFVSAAGEKNTIIGTNKLKLLSEVTY